MLLAVKEDPYECDNVFLQWITSDEPHIIDWTSPQQIQFIKWMNKKRD